MRFTLPSALIVFAMGHLVSSQTPGPAVTVSYDTKYDVSSTSVRTLACASTFSGYTSYASLPQYPYIAGSVNITGASDGLCGQCYVLEYAGDYAQIQVVDSAAEGFVLSEEAYQYLTMNYTSAPSITAYVVDVPTTCDPHAST